MILTIIILIIIIMFGLNKQIDPIIINMLVEPDYPLTNTKKRIVKAKISLISLLAVPFVEEQLIMLAGCFALFIVSWKLPYWQLKKQRNAELALLKFQFPIWLRQLQILIQTNTVVRALDESYSKAPTLIRHDLSALVNELEVDAIRLEPYLKFLQAYRMPEVERAMKLLYRYNAVGKGDAYEAFNHMIHSTTKWLRTERNSRCESKMMAYSWWGMLPLFAVTILFMAIMFEVIISLFGKGVA